jgi:hypothetical protein
VFVGAGAASGHDAASVIDAVLHDPQPGGWQADALRTDELVVRWDQDPPSSVQAVFVADSIEWVRVDEQLVLPRARLRLRHRDCTGALSYEGHHQELSAAGQTDVLVVIVSGERHPLRLSAQCQGERIEQRITFARSPRAAARSRVSVDVGCSVAGLTATLTGGRNDDWAYVGCRRVFEGGMLRRTQVLDVRVHWDNVGEEVTLAGRSVPAGPASIWNLRLRSGDAPTVLVAGDRQLELQHHLPAEAHFGTVGLGVGPASYSFVSPSEQFATVSPLATVYLAYRVSDVSRIVAFGGFHVNEQRDLDVGGYLSSETVRFFDRHASVNVLLGAQLIGFMNNGVYVTRLGIPQGAEVVWRDVGLPGWNVLLGAFFYPPIDGRIYASAWARYGTARLFVEANAMFRQEPLDDGGRAQAQSVGLSLGAPLFFFL